MKAERMTGTAMTEAGEFSEIYNLDVTAIPTNREVQRVDHDDEVYRTSAERDDAVIDLISDCRAAANLSLLARSASKNPILSTELKKRKTSIRFSMPVSMRKKPRSSRRRCAGCRRLPPIWQAAARYPAWWQSGDTTCRQ